MTYNPFSEGDFSAVFDVISITMPHKNWFIAGGSAVSPVYSDIDIFFTDQQSFDEALKSFFVLEAYPNKETQLQHMVTTDNATTFNIRTILPNGYKCVFGGSAYANTNIQLIKRIFGTPNEVINQFDINICQTAVLPSKRLVNPQDLTELTLNPTNISTSTPKRIVKYLHRNQYLSINNLLPVINQLIIDNPMLEPSYDDENPKSFVDLLYSSLTSYLAIKSINNKYHNKVFPILRNHYPELFL
jgi:hypothetical protein